MAEEEDSSEYFPDIKIYDEDHLYVWSIFLVFSLIFAVSYADSWNYVAFRHIKEEIIDSGRLVRAVSVSEDDTSSAEPLTSMSVASGASTFEVWMTLPKWAAQVLKYLAQETSYNSLAPLGIACVDGTPVSSFDRQDVDRLLFFCTNQDEDEATGNGVYSHLPRWSASLAKDRVKESIVSKPARQSG